MIIPPWHPGWRASARRAATCLAYRSDAAQFSAAWFLGRSPRHCSPLWRFRWALPVWIAISRLTEPSLLPLRLAAILHNEAGRPRGCRMDHRTACRMDHRTDCLRADYRQSFRVRRRSWVASPCLGRARRASPDTSWRAHGRVGAAADSCRGGTADLGPFRRCCSMSRDVEVLPSPFEGSIMREEPILIVDDDPSRGGF